MIGSTYRLEAVMPPLASIPLALAGFAVCGCAAVAVSFVVVQPLTAMPERHTAASAMRTFEGRNDPFGKTSPVGSRRGRHAANHRLKHLAEVSQGQAAKDKRADARSA